MTYLPAVKVRTDGEGHVLGIDVCICGPNNEGNDPDCRCHYPLEKRIETTLLNELGGRVLGALHTEFVWKEKSITWKCIRAGVA